MIGTIRQDLNLTQKAISGSNVASVSLTAPLSALAGRSVLYLIARVAHAFPLNLLTLLGSYSFMSPPYIADYGNDLRTSVPGDLHKQVRTALRNGLPAAPVVVRRRRHIPRPDRHIVHRVPLHHRLQSVIVRRVPVLDVRHVHRDAGRQRQRPLRRLG